MVILPVFILYLFGGGVGFGPGVTGGSGFLVFMAIYLKGW